MPVTDELAKLAAIPLGIIIQPLADLHPKDTKVPIVDFGESGPVRCKRCRAYINPFCVFTQGGSKFTCNLCGTESDGNHLGSFIHFEPF